MNHKQIWDEIVEEIQRRKDAGETLESIGNRISRSKAYIHKVLAGSVTGENINADKIKAYRHGLGMPATKEPKERKDCEYSLVRKVKAKLGAGSSLLTDDDVEGLYPFREDFLRRIGCLDPVLFDVMGESMTPTIMNGDTVLIDTSDNEIRSGLLYAVGIGEELHIKRIFVQPDQAILLKSDNKDHPSWPVPKDERPRIIGRAKWIGRRL